MNLLCPHCGSEKIEFGETISTLLHCPPFKDDMGYHDHDQNKIVTFCTCEKGHKFKAVHGRECPNKLCGWGFPPKIEKL